MIGNLVLILCLAKLASSGCNFDDSELKILRIQDKVDGQIGSDYSAIENPKRRFGFSELDGKTTVKYRLRGDGVNSLTRKAVEEVMEELQENVKCLNIEFTKESPQIEPSMEYVKKNINNIGNAKLQKEMKPSMTQEQIMDVFWKGWFEHADKLNPQEILTVHIDSTRMWNIRGRNIHKVVSGNVIPYMKLLTMDRALTKSDQQLEGTWFWREVAALKKMWKSTFMHEMFHVFGIAHTQRRSDRDKFIEIKWDNIQLYAKPQYANCTECTSSGPYECNSIMHYDTTSTSVGRVGEDRPTMVPKPEYAAKCTSFGNDEPTPNDWIALRNALGC